MFVTLHALEVPPGLVLGDGTPLPRGRDVQIYVGALYPTSEGK